MKKHLRKAVLRGNTVLHKLPMDPATVKFLIKAHEATGHVTMREHIEKMHRAVNKAIQGDERFNTAPPSQGDSIRTYTPKPYCIDITTPDNDGQHHAIIQTAKGELVRHGFDFNHDEGTCKLADGESCPTERTSVYAREIEKHEAMIKATENTISCRASGGTKLAPSEPWVAGKSVSYIYAPAGITTINAGFRKNESITCTIQVDEETAKDCQASFDFIASTEKQEPFADEDHESKKATLRFPPGKVSFTYGTHRGEEGVIVSGAEPTNYGAEAVNGKTYASWSPEFATDADYAKAKQKKGHWTFPDGVRGSASNPARLIAVNFVTGALTNKPAFKNMPPVKAKHVEAEQNADTVDATEKAEARDIIEAAWSDAAREAAAEARKRSENAVSFSNSNKSGIGFMSVEQHNNGQKLHAEAEKETRSVGDHNTADYHKSMSEYHGKMAKKNTARATDTTPAETFKAEKGNDTDPVLAAIAARQTAMIEEANVIALKDPTVKARYDREQAEANRPIDDVLKNIAARQTADTEWQERLLAGNPLMANDEALNAIANRNKEAVAA